MATIDKLAEELGELKVLDLANLVKLLEEKWGVSAAAVAAPVAASASAATDGAVAAPVEAQTEFDVVLTDFGAKKIEVIKVVRELTNLGLKEAKDLVEAAPKPVVEAIAKDAADAAEPADAAAGPEGRAAASSGRSPLARAGMTRSTRSSTCEPVGE